MKNVLPTIKRWLEVHPWDAVWVILLAGFGLIIGWWASVIIMDDAMITFRVAENLAFGRGFVYNPGETVQVTTTPLYAMVLVPGVWLTGSALRSALVLNMALATLIPVLAYDVGRRLSGRLTGIGGALLLAIAPFMVMAFSMESYLYVALILVSMDAYVARRPGLAGILVGVTALTRGDAVLMGASMLTYDVLAQRRFRWRLIAPAIAIPAAWYLFAIGYYGSPFPATLAAKTAQGEFNWLGISFIGGLVDYLLEWTEEGERLLYQLFPLLMIMGLVRSLWGERPYLILVGRDLLYLAAFTLLNVPSAEWYYAPLMPGAALLTARGVQVLADVLAGLMPRSRRVAVVSGFAALLLAVLLASLFFLTSQIVQAHPDWKARVYPPTARWIAQHTNSSASLGTIDIGHLGYWSGRPIIDIVGLAQPDVSEHIAVGDFGYALRQYQPDLVLLGYLWLNEVQNADWFRAAYVPRQYFKFDAMDQPLLLFSRREGVKVQTVTVPAAQVHTLDLDFNRQAILTGYHLSQPLIPGEELVLTLIWQVETPIEVDFTVFVQLVDAENNIKAQADRKPQNGYYATPYWQPGEHVIDTHAVPLPSDLPVGRYDLLFGLYEAETGLRLQILDEAGEFKSDHVRISNLEVQHP